jgi:CHASE3 domain sensor protein
MTNNLNTAEWIIVGILSFMLFVFLLLGIILLIKLIKISNQAKKIVETGQSVADKADDIAENIKDMTSVGSIAKGYFGEFIGEKLFRRHKKSRKNRDDE